MQAYDSYIKDGVVPVQRRDSGSSQFKARAYTHPLFGST